MNAKVINHQIQNDGVKLEIFIPNFSPRHLPNEIEVDIPNPTQITPKQRKVLYAFFKEIADYYGETKERTKKILKDSFKLEKEIKEFSLSDMKKELAREFIEWILDFMFRFEVPFSEKFLPIAREVNNFYYLCLKNRKCCICGLHADAHHVDSVGAGRDRTKINHANHRLMALCRVHHQESHTIGQLTFNKKYKVEGIRVNQETVKKLGI